MVEFDQSILQRAIPVVLDLLYRSFGVLPECSVELHELIACIDIEGLRREDLLQQRDRLLPLPGLVEQLGPELESLHMVGMPSQNLVHELRGSRDITEAPHGLGTLGVCVRRGRSIRQHVDHALEVSQRDQDLRQLLPQLLPLVLGRHLGQAESILLGGGHEVLVVLEDDPRHLVRPVIERSQTDDGLQRLQRQCGRSEVVVHHGEEAMRCDLIRMLRHKLHQEHLGPFEFPEMKQTFSRQS